MEGSEFQKYKSIKNKENKVLRKADNNKQGVTEIYGTWVSLMAFDRTTGAAVCWGDVDYGGNCAGMNFRGVTKVYLGGIWGHLGGIWDMFGGY